MRLALLSALAQAADSPAVVQECYAMSFRLTTPSHARDGDLTLGRIAPGYTVAGAGGYYFLGLDAYTVVLACREVSP